MTVKYRARTLETRDLTHDVKELIFEVMEPRPFHFVAGQFIIVDITEKIRRSYSIVSMPAQSPLLTLCLKYVEGGPASHYFWGLKAGDEMTFSGPHGRFVLSGQSKSGMLFVGTGTGIAPIRSHIFDYYAKNKEPKSALYFGVRSQRDIFYHEEFADFARQHKNFHYVLTLSRPELGWNGYQGRVTVHLEKEIQTGLFDEAYLCGGWAMIKEVREILKGKAFQPQQIHFEKFF